MMTPEQVQRTMEFILMSHAESAVRMDRIEESQERAAKEHEREHERFRASLIEQKERLDVLVSVTHDLLRVSRIQNERMKRLESKTKNIE